MVGFIQKQHRGLVLMCASATEDALVRFIEEHAATISLFRVTAPIPVLNRVRHLLGRNADAAVGVEVNYLGGDAQAATQIVLHDVGARPPWLVPSASQPLPLTAELARPGAASKARRTRRKQQQTLNHRKNQYIMGSGKSHGIASS